MNAGKHKRELVLAFASRTMQPSKASVLWDELRKGLEADAQVAADQVDRRLMLEQPWKGQRLPETAGGKRERVKGIDDEGKRENSTEEKRDGQRCTSRPMRGQSQDRAACSYDDSQSGGEEAVIEGFKSQHSLKVRYSI